MTDQDDRRQTPHRDDTRVRDERIQTYYADVFNEEARLTTRSAQGPLEFLRTQSLLRSWIPDGAAVIDVGGGTGHHARALQSRGCSVRLVDPVPAHVSAAREVGVDATIGDARELPYPDRCADVVLLFGPLYHLDEVGRARALAEAKRVVRAGGIIAAVGLSRTVALAAASGGRSPEPYPHEWTALLTRGTPVPTLRFPAAHFHTSGELADEVLSVGLDVIGVYGVEGPAGLALESLPAAESALIDAAVRIADAADAIDGIQDFSAHMLAIARRP